MAGDEGFQSLRERVADLGAGIGLEPAASSEGSRIHLEILTDRVRSLEQEAELERLEQEAATVKKRKGEDGLPTKCHSKSIVEPQIVANLAPLTDDKSLFRQWDGKLSNAFAHLKKGYAWALDAIKDRLDK